MVTGPSSPADEALVRWFPDALRGDERAARRYARAWQDLVATIIAEHPEASAGAAAILDHVALTAPFDPAGPRHALMSAASGIIPGMDSPGPSRRATITSLPATVDYQRFSRYVLSEISGAGTGLESLLAGWQMTVTEMATLFGVRRQAVAQWLDDGVPAVRLPKLATVLRLAELLERNLRAERTAAVVRAPSDRWGGASMLEMIAADRHEELLAHVARSFDWAASA
ncbi:MAG TPA: hypothetical protein VNC60_04250 [Actinomycetota bacterium]|nr:hypothetical protein [Actinomycetota bacterium]